VTVKEILFGSAGFRLAKCGGMEMEGVGEGVWCKQEGVERIGKYEVLGSDGFDDTF